MKQISWKIRKRVLKSPGFSFNFFCGNTALYVKYITLSLYGFWRSCDKLKSFYFYYHSVFAHQTWQNGNFSLITWSLVRSLNNLKSLYLHYHSAYGHQTWQAGDKKLLQKIENPSDHKTTYFLQNCRHGFSHHLFPQIYTTFKGIMPKIF